MSLIALSRMVASVREDQVDLPHSALLAGNGGFVQHALQVFFGITGAVAMLVIALGAFRYVISRGDPGAIKNAKETIIYAAIGLVVTITGYGIVTFVLTRL